MSDLVYLTKQLPFPEDSGGRLRTARLLRVFRDSHERTLLTGFGTGPASSPGLRVVAAGSSSLLGGLRRTRSVAVARWYSPVIERAVAAVAADAHVHVDFPQMLVNLPPGRRPSSVDFHNVESDLLRQRAQSLGWGPQRIVATNDVQRLAQWEARTAAVPLVTCCSEPDRARLAQLGVDAVLVPNGADLPPTPPAPAPEPVVLFVGALDWKPNIEGLTWFATNVWPTVRQRVPGVRFLVVGRAPGAILRDLLSSTAGVELHADVPSVAPYYARARLSVCPLLTGGGSRLKILESLAHGRPVVSTTLGAEGLTGLVGRGVDLRDDPDDSAARIVELLADRGLAERTGWAGRAEVERTWSWQATTRGLRALLEQSRP